MSDVAWASAPRWLAWLCYGFLWIYYHWPKIMTRGEYERLKDLDYVIADAHRALAENQKLREQLGIEQ